MFILYKKYKVTLRKFFGGVLWGSCNKPGYHFHNDVGNGVTLFLVIHKELPSSGKPSNSSPFQYFKCIITAR
uniref:Uncharacterized protein n=1 Tax=Rhizophagus irregularis (strain DAOM 181602 / DAOM 197198 / MUCL 43194) TaxID=747089 RepID=U9STK7_RHIID